MNIIILFLTLFLLISISVPVGLCIGGATMITLFIFGGMDMQIMATYAVSGINSFPMMAIPLFILAGTIMSAGGMAKRLVDVAAVLLAKITGGLGAVVALGSMFFGALSGSSLATVSAIGSIMVPEMEKKGYDLGYSAELQLVRELSEP